MADTLYLGAYWGTRRETSGDCAARTVALMADLQQHDNSLARWYAKGRSRRDALERQVTPDPSQLRDLFEARRNRRDTDGRAIEDLGARIALWNGAPEEEAVTMTVHCGSYASTEERWIPNSCVLVLPIGGAARERLSAVSILVGITKSVVTAFDPEWATVTSHALRGMAPDSGERSVGVGWITYLRSPGAITLDVPGSRVVDVNGSGVILVATEEPIDSHRADHVEAAISVWRTVASGRR
jgi:hypothetical protein